MLVRCFAVVVLVTFSSPVFAKTFCDTAFAEVRIDLEDSRQVRKIDWIQGRDVSQIRNTGILENSLAVLMGRPHDYTAVSFETFFDRAVVLFQEDAQSKGPVATLFILADNRNKSPYSKVILDLLSLHDEYLSPFVKQVQLFFPIERPDLARQVADAAKTLGLASTSIETNPSQITRGMLPGQSAPVDEFYDLVEIFSLPHSQTSGDFYAVTVYFE